MTNTTKTKTKSDYQLLCKVSDGNSGWFSKDKKKLYLRVIPISPTPDIYNEEQFNGKKILIEMDDRFNFTDNPDELEKVREDKAKSYFDDKLIVTKFHIDTDNEGNDRPSPDDPFIINKPSEISSKDDFESVPVISSDIFEGSITDFENGLKFENIGFALNNWTQDLKEIPSRLIFDDNNSLIMFSGITDQTFDEDGYHFTFGEGVSERNISRNELERNSYLCNGVAFIPRGMEFTDMIEYESAFLKHFEQVTKNENLFYDHNDLINFHTSMLSQGMVVLAGLSGTGKSQLVNAYAKAMGIEDNFCFVPVRPSWTDDSDMLGFADMMHNCFRPGDSGLVDKLIEAEKNPDQMYIVLFDEMNLAKVEQYFSQFLSVLEREDGERSIRLYSDGLIGMENNSEYKSKIKIGKNVLFVGTVNTDDSTFKLSDKVLDRSNVIHLRVQNFSKINQKQEVVDDGFDSIISTDTFESFKNSGNDKERLLTDEELKMLWLIHKAINQADPNVGIGWRIIKQMNDYLSNLPDDTEFTREVALDSLIKQRILSKIKGSRDQLGNLLSDEDAKIDFSDLTNKTNIDKPIDKMIYLKSILTSLPEKYDFTQSKSAIDDKRRDVDEYGITM